MDCMVRTFTRTGNGLRMPSQPVALAGGGQDLASSLMLLVREKDAAIKELNEKKDAAIEKKDAVIEKKDAYVKELIEKKDAYVEKMDAAIKQLNSTIQRLEHEKQATQAMFSELLQAKNVTTLRGSVGESRTWSAPVFLQLPPPIAHAA